MNDKETKRRLMTTEALYHISKSLVEIDKKLGVLTITEWLSVMNDLSASLIMEMLKKERSSKKK